MFNIFKEIKQLREENIKLKAQNEALMQFKGSFDNYYNDISGTKFIIKQDRNLVTLNGICTLDREYMHYPADECKMLIAEKISEQLIPFIEFDFVDNYAYETKDIVGRLRVLERTGS